jgi:hypothetical protein
MGSARRIALIALALVAATGARGTGSSHFIARVIAPNAQHEVEFDEPDVAVAEADRMLKALR